MLDIAKVGCGERGSCEEEAIFRDPQTTETTLADSNVLVAWLGIGSNDCRSQARQKEKI
jgi:hypothetical protein